MPLTPLQKDVLAVVAQNRIEESHVAGGIVLNAADDSARQATPTGWVVGTFRGKGRGQQPQQPGWVSASMQSESRRPGDVARAPVQLAAYLFLPGAACLSAMAWLFFAAEEDPAAVSCEDFFWFALGERSPM